MSADDTTQESPAQSKPTADDAADLESDDIADPKFEHVLRYLESFATKVIEQLNAKHGLTAPDEPNEPNRPDEPEASTEEQEDLSTQEPGTDAYDDIHGIPHYELE